MSGPDQRVLRARRLLSEAIAEESEVIVAVSGGADSLALAACVAHETGRRDLTARVVIVDHRLQSASADVAARAAEQTRALGLETIVVQVDVGTEGGPEAAARTARQDALLEAAGPRVPILLAHTRDDQAETVLLGLGRGSGARSLWGMVPVDGRWHRPFLAVSRADTEHLCQAEGLEFWQDPHNTDPRFRRVRIRHEVLPLLDEVLGGGVTSALARTADHLRRDAEGLDVIAAASVTHDVDALAAQHPAVRSRVLRLVALDAGVLAGELTAGHIDELDRLISQWRGQIRVELPGHVSAVRQGTRLAFTRTPTR